MKTLRFDSAARAELLHEIRFYGATRPGTGIKFQAAVQSTLIRIASNKARQPASLTKPAAAGCG